MEIKLQCTGYEIAADWYEGAGSNKILIVLPGYGSSKARQQPHAEAMVQQTGMSALVIDFSGHGVSPFKLRDTRPAQHFLELITAFDWLKQQYPDAEISVSGSSYGGFLAVQLTKYRAFANLVLRAPAIYKPNTFYDLWAIRNDNEESYEADIAQYRKDADKLAAHPLLGRASAFEGRTLVVVHELDEIVPRQTTDAYINAFNADTILAEGFPHSYNAKLLDPAVLRQYQYGIADWLNR